jgi:hypothetical protein
MRLSDPHPLRPGRPHIPDPSEPTLVDLGTALPRLGEVVETVPVPPGAGPVPVTGGGMIGMLDARSGLRGLWRDGGRVAQRLTLEVEGREPGLVDELRADELRVGPGSWGRDLPLGDGSVLEERGLLPDVAPCPVIQWTLRPALPGAESHSGSPGPLSLRIRLHRSASQGVTERVLSLPPEGAAVLAIVPPGASPDRTIRLVRALRARELQRAGRRSDPGEDPFGVRLDGLPLPSVDAALRLLDEAPSGVDPTGRTRGPYLAGADGAEPLFLGGSALAELGIAALACGWRPLARSILESLSEEANPPAVPLLQLAGDWVAWTGESRSILEFRTVLDRAVERLGDSMPPAAFHSDFGVLTRLLEGVERSGEADWAEALEQRLLELQAPRTAGARRLPVIGSREPTEGEPPPLGVSASPETPPRLPPPESFAEPGLPGTTARQTLQAARLLRSWVEGRLGARPEAAFGRFRLAPQIVGDWSGLEVRGLRVGDARVSLACRRIHGTLTFSVHQEAGRVPLQLVFEPFLASGGVREVRIGTEPADVEIAPEAGGVRLRCQFPLDSTRSLTIVTGPRDDDAPKP